MHDSNVYILTINIYFDVFFVDFNILFMYRFIVIFYVSATCTWKKQTAEYLPPSSSETQPSGRRGHTAVLYGDAMHVFGGFQDIRGSSSELWTFDFCKLCFQF